MTATSIALSLARDLQVDGSTIRRDLAQLTRAGLIRRTHGGALAAEPDAAIDTPYEDRRRTNLVAKKKDRARCSRPGSGRADRYPRQRLYNFSNCR